MNDAIKLAIDALQAYQDAGIGNSADFTWQAQAHKKAIAALAALRAQPAAQVLSDESIRQWWASENGLEDCDMCKIDDFTQVVRAVEKKLGAAQHVPETNFGNIAQRNAAVVAMYQNPRAQPDHIPDAGKMVDHSELVKRLRWVVDCTDTEMADGDKAREVCKEVADALERAK